jgi:hypothetical protein
MDASARMVDLGCFAGRSDALADYGGVVDTFELDEVRLAYREEGVASEVAPGSHPRGRRFEPG